MNNSFISFISSVLLVMFSFGCLTAQHVDVRIAPYFGFNQIVTQETINNYTYITPLTEMEGYTLREESQVINTIDVNYYDAAKLSVGIGYNAEFSEVFKYRVGLELRASIFNRWDNYVDYTRTVLSSDTVMFSVPEVGSGFGSGCDSYEDPFTYNLTDIQRRSRLHTVKEGVVTFEMRYESLAKGLSVGLGGEIITPLLSSMSWFKTQLVSREEDGLTICRNVERRIHDRTGNNLKNLKFGMNLFLHYDISERFYVQTGIHRVFSDTYNYNTDEINRVMEYSYRPMDYFVKVGMTLDKELLRTLFLWRKTSRNSDKK